MAQDARLPGEIAPLQPIAGPGAWYGERLQNRDDWVQPLSESDLSEIMAAITGVIERNLGNPRPHSARGGIRTPTPHEGGSGF